MGFTARFQVLPGTVRFPVLPGPGGHQADGGIPAYSSSWCIMFCSVGRWTS